MKLLLFLSLLSLLCMARIAGHPLELSSRAEEEFPFSPLDQTYSGVYTFVFLLFRRDLNSEPTVTVDALKAAVGKCFVRWPFLSGKVHVEGVGDGQTLHRRLVYQPLSDEEKRKPALLLDKGGRAEESFAEKMWEKAPWDPLSYEDYLKTGVPGRLDPPRTFSHFDIYKPREADNIIPVMGITLNWVGENREAIVLGVSAHHGVLDGGAITVLLQQLADAVANPDAEIVQEANPKDMNTINRLLDRGREIFEKGEEAQHGMSVFDFQKGELPNAPTQTAGPVVEARTATLRISNERVKELQASVMAQQPEISVSALDCLSALMWQILTRVRLEMGRVTPDTKTRFTTSVDFRRVIGLSQYWGDAIFPAMADSIVSQVVDTTDGSNHGVSPTTAHLAVLVRKAITAVDTDKVASWLELCRRHGVDVIQAITKASDRKNTGLGLNTWAGMAGADGLTFNLPGTADPKVLFIRRHKSAGFGDIYINPRNGGQSTSKSSEPWMLLFSMKPDEGEKVVEAVKYWADLGIDWVEEPTPE